MFLPLPLLADFTTEGVFRRCIETPGRILLHAEEFRWVVKLQGSMSLSLRTHSAPCLLLLMYAELVLRSDLMYNHALFVQVTPWVNGQVLGG
jgi:hypothetical protein